MTSLQARLRTIGAVLLVLLVIGAGAPFPSQAQTAPTPPEVPQEADPAIGIVGPAAQGVMGPLCSSLSGGLALAVVVASVAAGGQWDDVNPVYQDVLAAQVAACGLSGTETVGGKFIPYALDTSSASSVPSEPPLGTDGPRAGHVDAPVAQGLGGSRSATGAASPPTDSSPSNIESGQNGEFAAAPTTPQGPSGKGGKVALLAALALLTALSFIPSRPRTSAVR